MLPLEEKSSISSRESSNCFRPIRKRFFNWKKFSLDVFQSNFYQLQTSGLLDQPMLEPKNTKENEGALEHQCSAGQRRSDAHVRGVYQEERIYREQSTVSKIYPYLYFVSFLSYENQVHCWEDHLWLNTQLWTLMIDFPSRFQNVFQNTYCCHSPQFLKTVAP